MATSVIDLPAEIIYIIFRFLQENRESMCVHAGVSFDHGTLLQLQTTCQKWSQIARDLYYEKVDISRNEQKARLFLRTLQTSAHPIRLAVKELYYNEASFPENITLSSFVRLCPNLEALSKEYPTSLDDYLGEMNHLHQQGYIQKLKRVTPPRKMLREKATLDSPYIKLMLRAKQTISSLCLSDVDNYALLNHIQKFTSLKDVWIHSSTGITLHEVNRMLERTSTSLKSITIERSKLTADQQSSLESLCSNLKVFPQVVHLQTDNHLFSSKDVQLLQHMFPKLKEIFINKDRVSPPLPRSNDLIAATDINGFIKYLTGISKFYVDTLGMPSAELFTWIKNVAHYFQVCNVMVQHSRTATTERHELAIATKHFDPEKSYGDKGHKPQCILLLNVQGPRVSDAFCKELFTILADDVNPLCIAIDGKAWQQVRFGPLAKYSLNNAKPYTTLKLYNLNIDILSLTRPVTGLQHIGFVHCRLSPTILHEISQKITSLDSLQLINVRSDAWTYLTQIDMPFTTIGSLEFDLTGMRPSTEIVFRIYRRSGISYYYVDANGKGTKISRHTYLVHQKKRITKVDVHCKDLSFIIYAAEELAIV